MNTLDLALHKVKLKKVSNTKGGEWQGPCPGCGGVDRFHVWPNQNDGRGSYWCRSCEKAGDNIQFLRDFEGLSFKEACDKLNITIPESPAHRGLESKQTGKPEFTPDKHIPPVDLWQEKAEKLIQWSQANLAKSNETLSWLVDRGIGRETAENFRLGWNLGEDGKDIYRARKVWGLPDVLKEDGKPRALWIPRGLVIPYIVDGVIHRIRIRRPEGEPRYYVIPGSSMATMIIERARRAFVVVESELDAIAVAAHNNLAGSVALGSVAAKPDADTYAVLQGALQILNALDYGDTGGGAKAAERAMTWWKEQFDRCDRWPVPQGKDPGDAYKLGIDLDKWIKVGLPPALTMNDPAPVKIQKPEIRHSEPVVRHEAPENLSALILELYDLLRRNPGVKIYNTRNRFTVLRNGKYVGGRINELVFRTPDVTAYILNHPAEEIDGSNFIE
jgi:DNA primase